jgi:four helix bundle protein
VAHRALRPEELQQRLVLFGVAVCRGLRGRERDPVIDHIVGQLVRSATSPAANYAEATAAESRRDFVHKMQLCLKELRESAVWPQFAEELDTGRASRSAVRQECKELIAIFVASLNTARRYRRDDRCIQNEVDGQLAIGNLHFALCNLHFALSPSSQSHIPRFHASAPPNAPDDPPRGAIPVTGA